MAEIETTVSLKSARGIVQQIVERFHPQKVILFGSYAHGELTEDSDVDVKPETREWIDKADLLFEKIPASCGTSKLGASISDFQLLHNTRMEDELWQEE